MNTNQITATVTSQMYHDIVTTFELNNQDDMDSFITHAMETRLAQEAEQDAMDEYYQEYKQ